LVSWRVIESTAIQAAVLIGIGAITPVIVNERLEPGSALPRS
jgi:hypothetical protein